MESKEKTIERIAASLGQSYERVESNIEAMTNLCASSYETGIRIEEFKQAASRAELPKRRKQSNYTKPRNRKKKSNTKHRGKK